MSTHHPLILASTSPRRREILESMGLDFEVESVEVDESPLDDEKPDALVQRLAMAKASAARLEGCVLGSDTVVVLDGRVLGKPRDGDDAVDMLLALSGQSHQVLTGVALRTASDVHSLCSATEVRFREISRDEALAYWQSGEPADKAGAYGIQGKGGIFVESITGSYSCVMGLPVFETAALLKSAGFDVLKTRI